MKLAYLVAVSSFAASEAFVTRSHQPAFRTSCLHAAVSAEEDLELTRQVIRKRMDMDLGSTTLPAQSQPAPAPVVIEHEIAPVVDISIPYDAPARLAFEKAGSKGDYAAFKTKYEADAVADVTKKHKASVSHPAAAAPARGTPTVATVVDISIPYDAPARLAWEKAGSKGDYAAFKTKYEADAVADVTKNHKASASSPAAAAPAKVTQAVAAVVDISIPYDAPARLAWEKAGSKGDYAAFKTKYEADAVADVTKKHKVSASAVAKKDSQPASASAKVTPAVAAVVDISIPYDAPARLAFEKAGSKGDYAAFKTKYEADAVADVTKKQKASASTPVKKVAAAKK
jgi:hypothetical protein